MVMADGRMQAFGPKEQVLFTSLKAVPKSTEVQGGAMTKRGSALHE
jgi:ABC-type protease/lipase transport system fused ATPase/permease subunit